MSFLLGLDIGTTGCKAAIFDDQGTLLKTSTREYVVDMPHPSWAEQDAELVWDLALQVLCEAITFVGIKHAAAHTINTLPKFLWIKQNEPQVWAQAARFVLYEDFFIYRFTGQAVISRCLASRSQLYDTVKHTWLPEVLELLELDPSALFTVRPSGWPVARTFASIARDIGLDSAPLVVTGGRDPTYGCNSKRT